MTTYTDDAVFCKHAALEASKYPWVKTRTVRDPYGTARILCFMSICASSINDYLRLSTVLMFPVCVTLFFAIVSYFKDYRREYEVILSDGGPPIWVTYNPGDFVPGDSDI